MKKQKPFTRGHGILMPIFSLSGKYGMGTLGNEAYEFIDFLCRAGCSMWQLLPLGPTGYGNSPYQCFSAFAGNSYFLNPEWFLKKGWISTSLLSEFELPNKGFVDYGELFKTRKPLLEKVYQGYEKFAAENERKNFAKFKIENEYWLKDYCMFLGLKEHFGGIGRADFPKYKIKSEDAVLFIQNNLKGRLDFFAFLEYAFFMQWKELSAYAQKKGILLVGDIPIYVSSDSSDVWANPSLFMLNEKGDPTSVAGVPPDDFSAEGQLWGNPLYNWENHKKSSYSWWGERIKHQASLFNVIRIDHFIGISNYYSIPFGNENAVSGEWLKGPSAELTDSFRSAARGAKFIAEDLGIVTEDVKKLIKYTGFPSMKVMQFAFDGSDNPNLLHNIPKNSVVYTGTHDNQTTVGFFESCDVKTKKIARRYMNIRQNKALAVSLIRECHKSCANTVIIPLYDYLLLNDSARINTPATLNGNWQWRILKPPSNMLADEIYAICDIYKRNKPKIL